MRMLCHPLHSGSLFPLFWLPLLPCCAPPPCLLCSPLSLLVWLPRSVCLCCSSPCLLALLGAPVAHPLLSHPLADPPASSVRAGPMTPASLGVGACQLHFTPPPPRWLRKGLAPTLRARGAVHRVHLSSGAVAQGLVGCRVGYDRVQCRLCCVAGRVGVGRVGVSGAGGWIGKLPACGIRTIADLTGLTCNHPLPPTTADAGGAAYDAYPASQAGGVASTAPSLTRTSCRLLCY